MLPLITAVPSQKGAGLEIKALVHCRLCPDALESECRAPPEKTKQKMCKQTIDKKKSSPDIVGQKILKSPGQKTREIKRNFVFEYFLQKKIYF